MSRWRIYGAQFVLGLLLALTLWTYVSFTTNPHQTEPIIVPVEATGLQNGLIIVNGETGLPESLSETTTLTITGPEQQIETLDAGHFQATVNLEGAQPGPNVVEIDVAGPDSVRISDKVPPEITVWLARELVSTVPITIVQQGQPPFSFSVGRVTQGAQEAVVRGPEDLVRRVVAVEAEVNLQGQTSDLQATLPLTPMDAAGDSVEGVSVNPEQVSVRVAIVAQFGVQQVSVVPDLSGQPAPGYAVAGINWNPKMVRVVTSETVTSTFATEPITLTGLTSSITRTVSLQRLPNVITQPPDIRIVVRVDIVRINVPSQLPILVPVTPINLGDGLPQPRAQPQALELTLAGPLDQLREVTPDAITATVDLSGLGPGIYTLKVDIVPPPGLQIVAPADPQVTVTIDEPPTPTPEPTPIPPEPTPPPPAATAVEATPIP